MTRKARVKKREGRDGIAVFCATWLLETPSSCETVCAVRVKEWHLCIVLSGREAKAHQLTEASNDLRQINMCVDQGRLFHQRDSLGHKRGRVGVTSTIASRNKECCYRGEVRQPHGNYVKATLGGNFLNQKCWQIIVEARRRSVCHGCALCSLQ